MSDADRPIFDDTATLNVIPDVATALDYVTSRPDHPVPDRDLETIVTRTWNLASIGGVRFRMAFAMACLETGDFLYGGQVHPSQMMIGGIGATNDGADGISNASWEQGVDVFFAHLAAWCGLDGADIAGIRSPRQEIVRQVAKTKGFAVTWRDLGGRWAVHMDPSIPWQDQATMPQNYGWKIERRMRTIFGDTIEVPDTQGGGKMYRVAVAAGHRNTSGGNGDERVTTGILAPMLGEELAVRGIEVETITPDGGRGMFPGSLTAVANEVVRRSRVKAIQLFVELHTEGIGTYPNPVNGVFTIYPDWAGDTDADVRDVLGPMLALRIATRGKMGIRGSGVMSEKNTGVGGQGDRLGIFNATASERSYMSRMIIEYGAHTNEDDFRRHRDPVWQRQVAIATAECIVAFLRGEDLPSLDAPTPKPGDEEPQGGGPEDNPHLFHLPNGDEFYIVGPFFALYTGEPQAMRYWGWPRMGMFVDREPLSPYHGQLVQYFDRCVMHCDEGETDSDKVQLGALGYHEALGRGLIKP